MLKPRFFTAILAGAAMALEPWRVRLTGGDEELPASSTVEILLSGSDGAVGVFGHIAAGDVEGRAVIRTGPRERQPERHVHRLPEIQRLRHAQALVVKHRQNHVVRRLLLLRLRREQTVEDIGNAVVFLVSDNAMNITGQTLMVDGGMVKL